MKNTLISVFAALVLCSAAVAQWTELVAIDSSGNLSRQSVISMSGVQEFRTTGSSSWTVPTGINRVKVEIWGGGGGSYVGVGINHVGGGSGAYIEAVVDLSGISSLTVVVGSGGADGSDGDESAIKNGSTFLLRAGVGDPGSLDPNSGGTTYVNPSVVSAIAKVGFGGTVGNTTPTPYPGPLTDQFYAVGTGRSGVNNPEAVILEW